MIFILIAATITAVEIIYFINVESSESPLASIFSFTFDSLSSSKLFTTNELFIIHTTLDVVNFIAFVVVPFVIMAGCCSMRQIPMTTLIGPEYILYQSGQLKKLVTGASAIMVIGIIHMQLWLNWPLTFIEKSQETALLESINLAVCQYWGVTYTLSIAALYLPTANYLSDQAKITIENGKDEKLKQDPSKWLIENKMILSPAAQLPQIIAVIAPMLVGSFGSTLSELVLY